MNFLGFFIATTDAPIGRQKTQGRRRPQKAVKTRTQLKGKGMTVWTKPDKTGAFMDVKNSPKKFKGVRREKAA